MAFASDIARRYLGGRKSTQAIHFISGISILGLTIGTAALVLVLSVFNGLEDLIGKLVASFNPDVKIEIRRGKTFEIDTQTVARLRALPGVEAVSISLQEIALLEYEGSQVFATIKGVDKQFNKVNHIDSTIIEGSYGFSRNGGIGAVLGSGIASKLGVNIDDDFAELRVYTPEQQNAGSLESPFRTRLLSPQGIFYIQQDFDNEYILSDLSLVQDLLDKPGTASSLELHVTDSRPTQELLDRIGAVVGPEFQVKDRFGQDMSLKKLMQLEKWMSYAILCLTFILVAFNLVGALWMVVLDKREDIYIFRSMGATDSELKGIFIRLGLFYTGIGLLAGMALALILYYLQVTVGLIMMPEVFVVDRYPVSLRWLDLLIVACTVFLIGWLASLPAAARAGRFRSLRPDV